MEETVFNNSAGCEKMGWKFINFAENMKQHWTRQKYLHTHTQYTHPSWWIGGELALKCMRNEIVVGR